MTNSTTEIGWTHFLSDSEFECMSPLFELPFAPGTTPSPHSPYFYLSLFTCLPLFSFFSPSSLFSSSLFSSSLSSPLFSLRHIDKSMKWDRMDGVLGYSVVGNGVHGSDRLKKKDYRLVLREIVMFVIERIQQFVFPLSFISRVFVYRVHCNKKDVILFLLSPVASMRAFIIAHQSLLSFYTLCLTLSSTHPEPHGLLPDPLFHAPLTSWSPA